MQKKVVKYKWILIALAIKIVLITYLILQAKGTEYEHKFIAPLVLKSSDYGYFIKPVENYFETGVFFYIDKEHPFAGRMPGYWLSYFLLRFIFSPHYAIILMSILQILLSAISVYALARAAEIVSGRKKIFQIVFWIYAFNLYTISFDIQTQSESMAISCASFLLYFISKYFFERKSNSILFWAGFFTAWLIFLRPFMGFMILLMPCILFFYNYKGINKNSFKQAFVAIFIFCFSFILIETTWIVRNYLMLKEFIPLESNITQSYGKVYSKPWIKIRGFIKTVGENPAYFEPGTMAEWYRNTIDVNENKYEFNSNVFKNVSYTKDSLIELKRNYNIFYATKNDSIENYYEKLCINAAIRYSEEYKANNKINYYVLYPIKRCKMFIFNSGSSYLLLPPFAQMNWHQRLVKLFTSFYYYLVLVSSFIALIVALYRKKYNAFNISLFSSIFVLILIIVFYADIQENRYFMPVFPFVFMLVPSCVNKK
jgi:Alg9-like mannosyltransferase family